MMLGHRKVGDFVLTGEAVTLSLHDELLVVLAMFKPRC